MADRRILARLIRQGLKEIFEGIRDSLPEGERERASRRLEGYLALGDEELCWLLEEFCRREGVSYDPLDEGGLQLLALDLAGSLLDLPREVRVALKRHLAQRLGLPSA